MLRFPFGYSTAVGSCKNCDKPVVNEANSTELENAFIICNNNTREEKILTITMMIKLTEAQIFGTSEKYDKFIKYIQFICNLFHTKFYGKSRDVLNFVKRSVAYTVQRQ